MKRSFAILVLHILAAPSLVCQTTDSVRVTLATDSFAAIELSNTDPLTLNVVAPVLAGYPPTGQSDSSRRLWYTSANTPGQTRSIKVSLGIGPLAPPGTSLKIEAVVPEVPVGIGTAVEGGVIVDATPRPLVVGVSNVATGRGGNGAALTYALLVEDPASLAAGTTQVDVIYTLMDE